MERIEIVTQILCALIPKEDFEVINTSDIVYLAGRLADLIIEECYPFGDFDKATGV